jgi:hypothetical protein
MSMTQEEAIRILGPFAKHVNIAASIQEDDEDKENWLKTTGWNLAKTGEELFDAADLWEADRSTQRAYVEDLRLSGRLEHAPEAVLKFLDARGLL